VLELHKWLGHTHTKLGNFNAAADAFQAGIDDAKAAGNTAAHVDNAVGLGNLWKIAGQLTQVGGPWAHGSVGRWVGRGRDVG
jgi:hypothetical protein